jgi:Mrp family chromosome partitioning ATPase
MANLLDRFRAEFDMVLIDTPPMLQLSDARILGRLADGVVLVLRAGKTLLDNSALSARRFEEDGTPVFGAILNDWDPSKHGGYGYDSRYYEYIHGKTVPQS